MENLVVCKGLTKAYGTKLALNNVSFTLSSGKIIGLLGPNGAGKTTLIKIMAGLLSAPSGMIKIKNMDIGIESKKIVAYLPDRESLPPYMTAQETLAFYGDFFQDFDANKAKQMLDSLNISPDMKIKEMSKGTKEKVQLILTMSRQADLYILDEPIGGVDPAAREYILNTILSTYRPQASIIISTHLVSEIENILDEVIFIKEGEIVLQDEVDNIRSEKGMSLDGVFREVFRC